MAVTLEMQPINVSQRPPKLPSPIATSEGASRRTWPAQGEWTREDYARLPDDDARYEVLEGVLYVMTPAPTFDHQYAVTRLLVLLDDYVREHKLGIVLVAPFEVHLPDGKSVVQPDVLFVAAEHAPAPGDPHFAGVPDLIVEVLSPSTTRTDRLVKFNAYENAGVREYWIVNPHAHIVEVYTLSEEKIYDLHGQYLVGDTVTSAALADLALPVDGLFAT